MDDDTDSSDTSWLSGLTTDISGLATAGVNAFKTVSSATTPAPAAAAAVAPTASSITTYLLIGLAALGAVLFLSKSRS
jgi:hypothetical protein